MSTRVATMAGAIQYQDSFAATAAAEAQATDEKASAKVAMREDVWRRLK